MRYVNDKALRYAERFAGRHAAEFIWNVALLDFREYARYVETLGYQRISENNVNRLDEHGVLGGLIGLRGTSRYEYNMGIIENLMLLARYPFLNNDGFYTRYDDGNDDSYATGNMLHSLPAGWTARFGLELCEDIVTVLSRTSENHGIDPSEAIENYRVEQVKEKLGSLRWYDLAPEYSSDALSDLVMMYESLSMGTCCVCGSFTDVLFDNGGYVLPECFDCRNASDMRCDSESRITKMNAGGLVSRWIESNDLDNPFYLVPKHIREAILRYELSSRTHKDNTINGNVTVTTFTKENGEMTREITKEYAESGLLIMKLIKQHDEAVEHSTVSASIMNSMQNETQSYAVTNEQLIEMFSRESEAYLASRK